MSQPFNFNTPIEQNTTLVARYRCGDAPYAGKWFRMTNKGGQQFVPGTLGEAEAIARTGFPDTAAVFNLINTSTGAYKEITSDQIVKLELGGGWGDFSNPFFPIGYHSTTTHTTKPSYITGYPAGLVPGSNMFQFVLSSSPSNASFASAYSSVRIDISGFKFDKNMYNKMALSVNSLNNATLFNPYTGSNSSLDGGGALGLLNRCLISVKSRYLHLLEIMRGVEQTLAQSITNLGLVLLANMLRDGSTLSRLKAVLNHAQLTSANIFNFEKGGAYGTAF